MGDTAGNEVFIRLNLRQAFFLNTYITEQLEKTRRILAETADMRHIETKLDLVELEELRLRVEVALKKEIEGA